MCGLDFFPWHNGNTIPVYYSPSLLQTEDCYVKEHSFESFCKEAIDGDKVFIQNILKEFMPLHPQGIVNVLNTINKASLSAKYSDTIFAFLNELPYAKLEDLLKYWTSREVLKEYMKIASKNELNVALHISKDPIPYGCALIENLLDEER